MSAPPDSSPSDDVHQALTFVPGLGHATECNAVKTHSPRPQRHIWHHILPQVCGGQTVAGNLVSLCDNCHYAVHVFMWLYGQDQPVPRTANQFQVGLALQGYQAAVEAGTADKIPKEATPIAA